MAVNPDTRATFWYGCNMARHGEIIRLCTQILAAVGVDAAPAGGPGYCCGSPQEKTARIAAGMAERTVEKFNDAGRDQVITWCPSCHMNMDDFMAPVTEAAFETQHITELLHARRERLRPFLTQPVSARVLVHAHHGFNGRVPVNKDVPDLLRMIPAITVLDHALRVPGHMCSALASIPGGLPAAHRNTLAAMAEIGADTLTTVFHSCHREAVALERGRNIRVVNWIHLLAQSMGLAHEDEYKLWRNADDPRAVLGEGRIAALGETTFVRLVEPELRKPSVV
ncbi:MAG: (Fe-S)-binding protein [Acetobacteraceae bacterium]|nr:(Fe-S)-binding protein [Acetobacteraceae bacterium]